MEEIQNEETPVLLEFEAYRVRKNETEDLSHVCIDPESPTSLGIIVKYNGLAGNLPKTYNNSIALWSGSVPNIHGGLIKKVDVEKNNQAGNVFIKYSFQQSYYSLTYQVGTSLQTMCALAQLDTTSLNFLTKSSHDKNNKAMELSEDHNMVEGEVLTADNILEFLGDSDTLAAGASEVVALGLPTFVDLQILELTTSSVKVFYSTLPGYTPAKYKNWIGVWQGYAVPYEAPAPMRSVHIIQNSTQGTVLLDNISFSQYFTYTLLYFTGPERTNAASLIYFDTGGKVKHYDYKYDE